MFWEEVVGFKRVAICISVAIVGVSGLGVPVASAEATATELAVALDVGAGISVTAAGSAAVVTAEFNDFPAAGGSYAVVSTGNAGDAFPENPDVDAQLSTDVGADQQPDLSSLTVTVPAASGASCLLIDYALGTEEPVHTYAESAPSDTLSIRLASDPGVEHAMHAGRSFFSQPNWPAQPKHYSINAIDYWHQPGDPLDPVPGSTEEPRLPKITGLNHVTSRDTARIPLAFAQGDEVVTVSVADSGNGDLDSVAMVDHVRLAHSCDGGTGVEPVPAHDGGVIGGIRGVGNELWYDPIPSTETIERYDDPVVLGNGWRSPSNVPVELRFRWYRALSSNALSGNMNNWTPIKDADRQSYVPKVADRGRVLIVLVTGFVDGRRPETFPSPGTSGTWYVTLPIDYGTFESGVAPVVVGPDGGGASVGDRLTAQIGNTTPRQDTYEWQWYANGSAISGATAQSLTLGASQAGKSVTVRATAKRLNFDSKSWTSEAYGPIEQQAWTRLGTPTVLHDGTPAFGETLSADPGDGWAPAPDSYSYQWKRDGTVIDGATRSTYAVKAADVGARLSVDVAGVLAGYEQAPQSSLGVEVLGASMLGAVPTVGGSPQVGQQLTGTVVDWEPSGSSLVYSWYAGDVLLQSGTSRYLTVPAEAVGRPIVLRVTGSKSGFTATSRDSVPTSPVQRGALAAGSVSVSGYAKVGFTLSVSRGYWGPSGVSFTYQWKVGAAKVPGRKGRQPTLRLPKRAKGKKVSVIVTGRLAGYAPVTKKAVTRSRVVP